MKTVKMIGVSYKSIKSIFISQLKIFCLFAILFFTCCKQDNVDGILIDDTLYTHQTYAENKEFRKLIKSALNKDIISLKALIVWDCGGGAGCYDLGFVFTQIIYRMGEDEFIKLVKQLDTHERSMLSGWIHAGLEYGYETIRSFDIEFPSLAKELKH